MAMMIERYTTESASGRYTSRDIGKKLCGELVYTDWDQIVKTTSRKTCKLLHKLEQTMAKRKAKAKKRTVSFAPSVKTWDGLCSATHNLQTLISDYWNKKPSIQLLHLLLRDRKLNELCTLHDDLQNAVHRIQRLGAGMQTPLITTGVGDKIAFTRKHLPYIASLLSATRQARDECRRVNDELCDGLQFLGMN